MKNGAIRIGFIIGMLGLLAACGRTTPEQRLRATLAGLQESVEHHDPGGMKDVIADDFVGNDGLDRNGAIRIAQLAFLQHHDIAVRIGPLDIDLLPKSQAPDHATVRFTAALAGGPGTPLPDTAGVYQVETGWRFDHGEWRLTSATWKSQL